jgi:hypothetical protein
MRPLDALIVSPSSLLVQEIKFVPGHLSSEGPLKDYKLPNYLYYPTKLLPNGTRDWARVRLLQACDRLNIPEDRWPKFSEELILPSEYRPVYQMAPFSPPELNDLREAPGEWMEKAVRLFRVHCTRHLERVMARIQYDVKRGILTRIPQPKEKSSALALRYEWAAKRYCFNEPYKAMATDEYSPERIRKAVNKILHQCCLSGRK